MNNRIARFLSLLSFLSVVSFSAFSSQVEIALHHNIVNTDQDDALSSAAAVSANFLFSLNDAKHEKTRWLVETGVLFAEPAVDEPRGDDTGLYQVQLQTNSANVGARFVYRFAHDISIFTRAGLMLWHMELDVDEYFSTSSTAQSVSASDDGVGYYWGVGTAFDINDNVYWLLQLSRHQHVNAFDESADKAFNLTFTSFSLGVNAGF